MSADPHIELSEDDRMRVALQVDHFIALLSTRYGVEPGEVIEMILWFRSHRTFEKTMTAGGTMLIIGTLVSAGAIAMWEGIRHFLGGGK